MPRPSWNGHLRLSLVSCPIYLSPATSESERIRLNMINPATGNRISMKTVDAETGAEVERSKTVKGYQVEKGEYVILDPEELDSLEVESTRILDLAAFVDRSEVDPLYIETPYYVYPEKTGEDAYRVIAQAMTNRKQVALGRIVLSTREHPVMVEPFLGGLLMSVLRAADEVRKPEFEWKGGKLNPQMVELAETIMSKLDGDWNPDEFRDRYQDALRELIEEKRRGKPVKKKAPQVEEPSNVVDLMSLLKRSLNDNLAARPEAPAGKKKRAAKQDRRQGNMLLPVGGAKPAAEEQKKPSAAKSRRRA